MKVAPLLSMMIKGVVSRARTLIVSHALRMDPPVSNVLPIGCFTMEHVWSVALRKRSLNKTLVPHALKTVSLAKMKRRVWHAKRLSFLKMAVA